MNYNKDMWLTELNWHQLERIRIEPFSKQLIKTHEKRIAYANVITKTIIKGLSKLDWHLLNNAGCEPRLEGNCPLWAEARLQFELLLYRASLWFVHIYSTKNEGRPKLIENFDASVIKNFANMLGMFYIYKPMILPKKYER